MHSLGKLTLFECPRRADVALGTLLRLFVLDFERIRVCTFGLEFPVVVDDVVTANPDYPGDERAGLRPVRVESTIYLDEDLLSQVFSFIKSSNEALSSTCLSDVSPFLVHFIKRMHPSAISSPVISPSLKQQQPLLK